MSAARILFVEDDESLRKVLTRELGDAGFDVQAFPSAEGVVEAVKAALASPVPGRESPARFLSACSSGSSR